MYEIHFERKSLGRTPGNGRFDTYPPHELPFSNLNFPVCWREKIDSRAELQRESTCPDFYFLWESIPFSIRINGNVLAFATIEIHPRAINQKRYDPFLYFKTQPLSTL